MVDFAGDPEASRLSDAEAVEWLVMHGFDLPDDLAGLADNHTFQPGPPLPKDATKDHERLEDIPTDAKPTWNKDKGELTLGGHIVKKVRSVSVAKNVVRILDVFEEDGWPDRIDDPLDPSKNQQRLHEAIKRLNDNLTHIHFKADGTGQGIVWERLDRPGTAPDDSEVPF
ncbi:MAG: hypothetical protein GX621_04495 [Pirellulaceae bacterium]|nr:hypothetical protein [Pirellulaceae bacterium]